MSIEYLPEKTYERNLNHNYMIIKEEDLSTDFGYQVKMLTDNHIEGLLPVSLRVENGIEYFYYEIQSKQTIERIYDRKSITYEELQLIIKSFFRLEQNLQNYLLSYDSIILDPSFLFMDMDAREVQFIYFPGYEEDARCGFIKLVEYMLTKTDHADERAVVLIYKIYRYTRNENFVLSEIAQLLEDTPGIQLSKELAEQQIPDSTSLTGAGVEAPWNEELKNPVPQEESWREQTYQTNSQTSVNENKKSQSGLPPRILMIVSIIISVILLGILSAEKWFEVIQLSAKTEMFVFAGIIIFAVLGILFNIMAAAKEKEQKSKITEEQNNSTEERNHESRIIQNLHDNNLLAERKQGPIQYRQIGGSREPERYAQSNYQFFGTAGETTVIGDYEEKHVLRGCDGNNFEYKMDQFPVLIGRVKPYVDIAFDDHSVSKMHAKIDRHGDQIYIEDMNSTNGIKKNGELIGINESVPVLPGDELMLGKIKLRYSTT